MIASNLCLQSALNFFFLMNGILICLGCLQIFEMFHSFEGFITYLYAVNFFFCMLVSRHDLILGFLSIHF